MKKSRLITGLQTWKELPFSLFSRCHLINMVPFARLLYPLQTILCLLKHPQTTRPNKALTTRKGKKPWISLDKLYLSKTQGRLNLPNICLYNLACHLRHALDWFTNTSHYSNIQLEQATTQPWHLAAMLHSALTPFDNAFLTFHQLTRNVFVSLA